MTAKTIWRVDVGASAYLPGTVKIQGAATDTYTTITTAGYITAQEQSVWDLQATDIVNIVYGNNSIAILQPSLSSGVVTLVNLLDAITGPASISTSTSSATPGTIRAIKGVMTGTATTMTSGNLVGVRGEVDCVGASGGFLYGAQGKVISTGTLSGSSWTAGVFAQFDISAATINAGQTAPIWADYGTSSGTITSATGMRMFAGTNTTAATLNAMIYLYGKTSNLFELDANGSTYISTGGATASGTIKKIAILIEGVQYYLQAATVYS